MKTSLYDAQNPARQLAIAIIEQVIEPLLKKGLNGEIYYNVEDKLTFLIAGMLCKPPKKKLTKRV